MYFKYTDGSLIQLVQARYARTDPQDLMTYHVPLTNQNGAIPLGQDWQTWTISGVIADPMSVRWHDIVMLSLDNVSWRTCRVQVPAFPSNMYQQSLYELTVLVSPTLEGPIVRYPTTGYKWGNQSITGISQAGNVSAYPIIHYLAPLFYAPLSNTLLDFTGQAVTFTRTASKVHAGVTYGVNVPIFDSGLYLASDTAQDVAKWTPPVSTLKTVAMQIKSRYPSPWSIGGGGINLLTANQSNIETNITGFSNGNGGTLTRDTVAPLVGTGSLKLVSTGSNDMFLYTAATAVAVTAGMWYTAQSLVKCTVAAGRQIKIGITWLTAAGAVINTIYGTAVACPSVATVLSVTLQALAGATQAYIRVYVVASLVNEVLVADSLMFEAIPTVVTFWTAALNKLTIDTVNNLIKWTDDTTTVSLALPAAYLSGTVMDLVVRDDTFDSVTIAAHPAGGAWTSVAGTLAALAWPQLTLGNLEGSMANLIEYPYILTSEEFQAIAYSSLSLLFNTLYVGNKYAGEIVKGSDKRLLNALGSDISALLGGTDIAIGSAEVTISQTAGLSARWYVELKRTDV